MTKKDYQLIASVMLSTRPMSADLSRQWARQVRALARAFQVTNQRFNQETFFKACGLEPDQSS